MNWFRSWWRSGLLRKILLAILACSLPPLLILGGLTLYDYKTTGDQAIERSKAALDAKSMQALEGRAADTAAAIARFLTEREDDLRVLAALPRTGPSYLAFSQAHRGELWTGAGKTMIPLYREVSFVNPQGQEVVRVRDEQIAPGSALVDVSDPANTLFKCEDYVARTIGLAPGEIYVGRVTGLYVPMAEAYAGAENPAGRRFQGVIRYAMPVYERNALQGIVVLGLNQAHVIEFTNHMVSSEERFQAEVDVREGRFSYIISPQGFMVAHPRECYILGVDEHGQPVPVPQTPAEFEQAQETGVIPLNANYMGFIDQNIPLLAERNRAGESGSLPIYIWRDAQFPEGRERTMAYATIPYYGGVYDTPAGFGAVTMTAFASDFHQAATELGADIAQEIQLAAGMALVSLLLTAAFIAVVGWLLARHIARPVREITAVAEQVSRGDYSQDISRIIGHRADEFTELAEAFNFMVAKVEAREFKLRQQVEELKIEIDLARKERQVAEITETDYFRRLSETAQQLRRKREGESP